MFYSSFTNSKSTYLYENFDKVLIQYFVSLNFLHSITKIVFFSSMNKFTRLKFSFKSIYEWRSSKVINRHLKRIHQTYNFLFLKAV